MLCLSPGVARRSGKGQVLGVRERGSFLTLRIELRRSTEQLLVQLYLVLRTKTSVSDLPADTLLR